MNDTIHIYHTNDLHSHFESWPRIEKFLAKRKKWHEETGDEMIVVDVGDHIDRSHPFTEGTYGKGNIKLLNEAGYQYAAIGNNEGITLPHNKLDELYINADFKVLAANIYDLNGDRPAWAVPSFIHETKKGMKVGLIGVTAYYQKYYELLEWKITDPFQAIETEIEHLKNKADIIVLLSHLGLYDDERIAEDYPDVDVILGSHTHHVLHEGKEIRNTLVCGAGKYGYYVGHVELNGIGHDMVKKARVYEPRNLEPAQGEEHFAEDLYKAGKNELSTIVAHLPVDLTSEWFEPSDLPRLLCEGLTEWCKADCSFLNSGLILEMLPKGAVTKFDIHRICPHPINPCVAELQGNELKEILLQSKSEEWPELQIKGLGFRGRIMGNMVYDRIEFNGTDIKINGEPLHKDQTYRLAIPDMFTFGHFFPHLQRLENKHYYMPEFLRDILELQICKAGSSADGLF
ncbi:2',3'-cyclic-nucleotide 2'-phosphodiesterase (5'-nucleotidase family) [Peribacillus deserti]|uniref:2',3'-cyclic-nucleotide 2'-phosphodiesterase (5'-nucleotidase family) n=1 Tax=Peribacillus deserti TaxID=673318 RepID=A0ABS2QQE1_9BACI|nr:bifunctional UDP-sugar hydrolase/5'-nucleotidase [Peribacillus deserti]MBM7694466.1 2',3'-cyclic-nucleotide 2'-phosphodiesterase (5'-nucleotidase family) [Peribacillus deserti]